MFRAFSMAVRRWYILLPLILVAVGASWLVYNRIPASYTASAVSRVDPPKNQGGSSSRDDPDSSDSPDSRDFSGLLSHQDNPFADPNATAGKLAAVVAPRPGKGAAPPFTVTTRPDAPTITVSASASSAASALGTVNGVTTKLTSTLAQLQAKAAVPTEQRMVLDTATPAAVAPPVRTTGVRVFAVTLLFGLLLSVVIAAAVERTARRRRELLEYQDYDGEYEDGEDTDAADGDAERADAGEVELTDAPDPSAEPPTPVMVPEVAGAASAAVEAAPKWASRSVPVSELRADVDVDAPTQITAFQPVPPLGRNASVTGAAASSAAVSSFGGDVSADEAPTQIGAIGPIRDDLPQVSRSVDGVKQEPPRGPRADLDNEPRRSVGGLDAATLAGAVGLGPVRPGGAPDGDSLLAWPPADKPAAQPLSPVSADKPVVGERRGADRSVPGVPSGSESATVGLPPRPPARPERAVPRRPDRREPVEGPRQARPELPESRRAQLPGRPDQRGGGPARPGQPGRAGLAGRPDQLGGPARSDQPGRVCPSDRPIRPDRPGRPEQGVRPGPARPERSGRADHPGRPGRLPPSRPDEAASVSGRGPNRPPRGRPVPAGPPPGTGLPAEGSGGPPPRPRAAQPRAGADRLNPLAPSVPVDQQRPPRAPDQPGSRPPGGRLAGPPSSAAPGAPVSRPRHPVADGVPATRRTADPSAKEPSPGAKPPLAEEPPRGPKPPPGPRPVESPSAERPAAFARPEPPRPVNRFGGPDPETFASSALWDPVTPSADGPNRWLPAAPPPQSPRPAAAPRDDRPRDEPVGRGPAEQSEAIIAQHPDAPLHPGLEPEGSDENQFGWPMFDETVRSRAVGPAPDEPAPGVHHGVLDHGFASRNGAGSGHDTDPRDDVDPRDDADPHHDVGPRDGAGPDQGGDGPSPGRHDDHERSHEPASN